MQSKVNSNAGFSLNDLVGVLCESNGKAYVSLPGEVAKQTTIKLEPQVREFCEDYAKKLGVSFVSFVSMVLKGAMLQTTNPVKYELTLVYERFFQVFKDNNIAIVDIPNVLKDFNISLSILSELTFLLNHLSDKVFSFISSRFEVNKEWLKGVDDDPGIKSAKKVELRDKAAMKLMIKIGDEEDE